MTVVQLITLAILGLHPEWRDDACERAFATNEAREVCETSRDQGRAWAEEMAGYIVEESARIQEVCEDGECRSLGAIGDPMLLVAVGEKESSFAPGDFCVITLSAERVTDRQVVDEDAHREWITFTRNGGTRTGMMLALILEDTPAYLRVDRCAHGEVGTFQLRGREIRSGRVVPATGDILPSSSRQRRVLVEQPRVNTSLAALALAENRDYQCEVEEDTEDCESSPWNWIGMYNTGRRSGDAWEGYTSRVRAIYERAWTYVCEQPDAADVPECRARVEADVEAAETEDERGED